MARPLRIEYEGALYHITSRGNAGDKIFHNDEDRSLFLHILKKVNDRFNWLCHAYCLMDNHYHLIIETPDGNLSKGMRQLNGVYTQAFNKEHKRAGHLMQGRFKSLLLEKDNYLLIASRHVVLNPLRTQSVARPDLWKWSSFRGMIGLDLAHPCLDVGGLLARLDENEGEARKKFFAFVMDGIGRGSLWKELKVTGILGSEEFVKALKKDARQQGEAAFVSKVQRFLGRPDLFTLFDNQLMKSRFDRDRLIIEAVEKYGYGQKEVGDFLGLHFSTISRIVNERDPNIGTLKTGSVTLQRNI
jgi:REP element-mobilizing transposase RayT